MKCWLNKLLVHIVFRFFVFLFLLSSLPGCEEKRVMGIEPGKKAPDITLTDLDGKRVSLEDFYGKTVLIHFWADYCSECRAEFPRMEQAYRKFKAEGLEILAINVGQSREHVASFRDEFNLTFSLLLDPDTEVSKLYEIRGLPTNYFVTRDGKVGRMIIGWIDEKHIIQYLGEQK